jgi:hypothetical protein|tara:strand:+ start:1621 stop:1848 length:228 start_codon:yes stop_codon:yes gene_type:complete
MQQYQQHAKIITWKEALVKEVFQWQVYVRKQHTRAPRWLLAANQTYKLFQEEYSLSLSANIDGPVGKSVSFTLDG